MRLPRGAHPTLLLLPALAALNAMPADAQHIALLLHVAGHTRPAARLLLKLGWLQQTQGTSDTLASLPTACRPLPFTHRPQMGLHDVRAAVPSVRYVPIREGPASGSLACPLADVMPLRALLAPVGTHKDAISAALEGLAPEVGRACSNEF